jgi:molybdopterin-biosynthesis enzyme MoeA-like protein
MNFKEFFSTQVIHLYVVKHMNAICQIKSLQMVSTLVHVALIAMFASQSPKYLQKNIIPSNCSSLQYVVIHHCGAIIHNKKIFLYVFKGIPRSINNTKVLWLSLIY